jgi:hypothetical protein
MFALYHYVRLHSGFRLASLLPLRVVLAESALNIHSLPLTIMNPGFHFLDYSCIRSIESYVDNQPCGSRLTLVHYVVRTTLVGLRLKRLARH